MFELHYSVHLNELNDDDDDDDDDCLSVEGKRPVNTIRRLAYCSYDLDLDPMTLI